MTNYLEEDEVLELLEDSEDDDDSWSEEEEAIESSDDNGEIDHLSEEDLSPSNISDIDEDQDTSSTIFISRNKKENWSSTPHTNDIGRTAACNIRISRETRPFTLRKIAMRFNS